MTWAARRRFLIIFILVVVIGGLAFWHYSPSIFVAPTCSDNRQNGDERGVDCGGSMCSTMCTADVQIPTVLWQRSFLVAPGVYNAAAYIQNKNATGTRRIVYEFRLYDARGILVARRDGAMLVPPLGNYAAIETGIQTGNALVSRTTFEFSKTPAIWERVPEALAKLRLRTENATLDALAPIPKLSATLVNQSTTIDLENLSVGAILYDADDNAVNVSRTIVPNLVALKSTNIVFTWPRPFPQPVVRYEILPVLDVFRSQ